MRGVDQYWNLVFNADFGKKQHKFLIPGRPLDDRPLRGRGVVPGGWHRGTKKDFQLFF